MVPTTRAGTKPTKTIAKSPRQQTAKDVAKKTKQATGRFPIRGVSTRPIARQTAAKSAAKLAAKKPVKQPAQGTSTNAASDEEAVECLDGAYCEGDRRLHGTFRRCGHGALLMAYKTSAVTPTDTNAVNRTLKEYRPCQHSDLDYDPVVRNAAKTVLHGLGDIFGKINTPPVATEPSLEGLSKQVGGAIDMLREFVEMEEGKRYDNPNPDVRFRKEYEEGDGVGNWILFKPTWFERGAFGVGSILTFGSTLEGFKAEGEVVTVHR